MVSPVEPLPSARRQPNHGVRALGELVEPFLNVRRANQGTSGLLKRFAYLKTNHYLTFVKQYYVYIILCYDGSYYVGVTSDLEKRLEQHHTGFYPECYTYSRRPLVLKHTEIYQRVYDAIEREKQLKGWSRKKKEALINERYAELKKLAKNRSDIK